MKTKSLTLIALLIFSVSAVLTLNGAAAADWQTVATYNGIGDKTTPYFSVTSDEWQIRWSYTAADKEYLGTDYATFGYTLYTRDGTWKDAILKFGVDETASTQLMHSGNNEFYIDVSAANLEDWQIIVEQDVSSASSFGSNSGGGSAVLGAIILFGLIGAIVVIVVLVVKLRRKNSLS